MDTFILGLCGVFALLCVLPWIPNSVRGRLIVLLLESAIVAAFWIAMLSQGDLDGYPVRISAGVQTIAFFLGPVIVSGLMAIFLAGNRGPKTRS